MALWPVGLRQQIVDDVDSARPQERQRLVQLAELAGPGIRVDQIELIRRPLQEVRSIHHVERHTSVRGEMPPRGGDDSRIGIDGLQRRRGIHTSKQPGGAMTGPRPKLQKPSARLRGDEGREHGPNPRLRRHVKTKRLGVAQDVLQTGGTSADFEVIHGRR